MASLKQRLDADIKSALLARDSFRTQVLRGLKAVILDEEVATNTREAGLDDATIQSLVAKEVKKRREAAQLYTQNDRPELAESEMNEMAILGEYLPEQLSKAELLAIVKVTIAELGATTAKDMGRVIGAVKAKVGQSADSAAIASLVKEALS